MPTRIPKRRLYPATERLRSLLRSLMDKQGFHDERAVSRASGGIINHSALFNILVGNTKNVRRATLDALADVLKVDAEDLIRATVPNGHEPWVWPDRFDRYPVALRASIEQLVDEQLRALDVKVPHD